MTDGCILSNQFSLSVPLWNNNGVLPHNLITNWITCTSLNQNTSHDNYLPGYGEYYFIGARIYSQCFDSAGVLYRWVLLW